MNRIVHDVSSSFVPRHAWLSSWLVLVGLALGCAQTSTAEDRNNGNTNWLRRCTTSTDCDGGSSCVDGLCTSPSASPGEGGSGASSTPSAATADDAGVRWGVGTAPSAVEGTRLCAGVACESGELCCYASGSCFDPSDRAACPAPSAAEVPGAEPGATLCASDADCPEGEACTGSPRCLGAGLCQSRSNCPSSSGRPGHCGCDGLDYPDLQSACVAGARIAVDAPCGVSHDFGAAGTYAEIPPVTGCGSDADCGSPASCCYLTGLCYDPAEPILCTVPPEGTMSPCLEDAQCWPGFYCKREGCEGPGGCVGASGGECGGRLEPVCGCDGASYTSAECADAEGTNVSHAGACEEP